MFLYQFFSNLAFSQKFHLYISFKDPLIYLPRSFRLANKKLKIEKKDDVPLRNLRAWYLEEEISISPHLNRNFSHKRKATCL